MLRFSGVGLFLIAAAVLVGATCLAVDAAAPRDVKDAAAPADQQLAAPRAEVYVVLEAGQEFMAAGYLTLPERARRRGIATVKCMHLKGITMDEASAPLVPSDGDRFECGAKLRAPDRSGIYTLEVWFEGRRVCLTRVRVEEPPKP